MKTIKSIKTDLSKIARPSPDDYKTARAYNLALKRSMEYTQWLQLCIRYVEQDPDKGFILREIARINNRIALICDGYKQWVPERVYPSEKAKETAYLKLMGIKELKAQLKTLQYLMT